jgi:aminopeptidase N
LVDNDEKWRMILRKMNKDFYHQTVTTVQIENFLSKEIGIDLSTVFNQYLRGIKIPTLEYQLINKVLKYRWTNVVEDFKMPLKIFINNKAQWIHPTSEFQKKDLKVAKPKFKVDPNFYILTKN